MPVDVTRKSYQIALTLFCFACFGFAALAEAQQFRTFTTLPQEAETSICFRTFVPAEATQARVRPEARGERPEARNLRTHSTLDSQLSTQNFQTFQPVKVEQSVSKPAQLPKAKLITPTAFVCPPCEVWKKRIKELPFEVEVVKSRTSPVRNRRGQYVFPVFSYRQDGKLYHYQGSIDGFLRRLNQKIAHR